MTKLLSTFISLYSVISCWGKQGLCWNPRNVIDIISDGNSSIISNFSNATSYDIPASDLQYINNEEHIVELLIVVEKALGDVFHQNRQEILKYYTIYFWDVNLRYKTIPGLKLSFRVVHVLVINEVEHQPFIESSRDPDNSIDFDDALTRFNDWLDEHKRDLPNFDVATLMVISKDRGENLGIARIRGVCQPTLSGTIIQDDGAWGNVSVGAHEIGHVLGAPHDKYIAIYPDQDQCPTNPDTIMASGDINTREKRWYFSPCSSAKISQFLRSPVASCTRQTNHQGQLPISPGFSHVLAPSMSEQCKRLTKNHAAFVRQHDTSNCKDLKCVVPIHGGGSQLFSFKADLDNSKCSGGNRCFRGTCRETGSLFVNIASGKCLSLQNKFQSSGVLEMTRCPESGTATPLDQFVVRKDYRIATPFHSVGGDRIGEACIHYQRQISSHLLTQECDNFSKWQQWELRYRRGSKQFLLRHKKTKRCALPNGNRVKLVKCSKFNSRLRWALA